MGEEMKFSMGRLRWRRWWCLVWVSAGLQGMGVAEDVGSPCVAPGTEQPHGGSETRMARSERMTMVQRDGILGSTWGVVMDCRHPEWPARMVIVQNDGVSRVGAASMPANRPQLIRAGERVQLWRQDAAARIETSGAAEESGVEGQRIRVRLVRAGVDGEVGKEFVMGVVRGPGSVEILR